MRLAQISSFCSVNQSCCADRRVSSRQGEIFKRKTEYFLSFNIGVSRDLWERFGLVSSAYDMTQQQMNGILRFALSIASNMQATRSANSRHTIHRLESSTIGYCNLFVCPAAELQCMRYTREIDMHLHFDGFLPFIYTDTIMHVLSAVITHPVRGRAFVRGCIFRKDEA